MRSFKKIAAMIMAVAMLCSFTALAADPKVVLDIAKEIDSTNPTIALNYESTAAQTTMLVYRGEALTGADVVYINQFAENASAVTLDLTDEETGMYTVVAGGMDVAKADTAVFNYKAVTYAVTLNAVEGGLVTCDYTGDLKAVNKGAKITFKFIAELLGYIPSVTVDGVKVDVNDKNELEVTVDDNMTINVTFVEAVATEDYQSFNGAEIHDIAATPDAEDNEDRFNSKLMFGKAIAPAGAEVLEAGMYLEKWNGTDWEAFETETFREKFGPYFKADADKITADGKYGIRFIRFNEGRYQVKSYVKYGDGEGDVAFGVPVEFVVE